MTLRIYGPEMYLELARSFARATVAITKPEPDLQSPVDLPIAIQVHMQLVMTAVTVIFSVSFLEGHVNQWFDQLLNGGLDLSSAKHFRSDVDQIQERIVRLQSKYPTEEERDRLFRNTKLTEKIKDLYRVLGSTPLHESPKREVRKLWEQLIELQNLRNDLIHMKPEFLRSPRFMDFLRMDAKEREGLANVPTVVAFLLVEQLPVADVNFAENVMIAESILVYANKHPFEEFLLGREYTHEEKQRYMTRKPRPPQ